MIPVIRTQDIKGKTILLRVDINSPVNNKKVLMSERIEEAAKSILFLQKKKAKVIVLAHQGRKGDNDFTDLSQHCKLLNKFIKIRFIPDIFGDKAQKAIKELKPGEAILLDNVRNLEEETKNDLSSEYVKILASLSNIYVNDAFSVSHREQSSVTAFPQILPSYAGINLEKELQSLEKIKIKDALYILAGSKTEENVLLINPNSRIIVAGMFGQLCMLASGFRFGKHEEFLDKKNIQLVKEKISQVELITPQDFAVKEKGKRLELDLKKFPNDYEIFDIGEMTIEKFKSEISRAKAIFMKGPMGYCEEKLFQKGTKEILLAISKSKAFSVLGGGHLTTTIKELKLNKKDFNHISLSGGALVTYLAGKKLPGIEILNQ